MLITMGNPDLVSKLITLAGGDIDLVQLAIRSAAKDGGPADLEDVVEFMVQRRGTVMSDIIERLEGVPSNMEDACYRMQAASDEIRSLRERLAQAEDQVETWRDEASRKDAALRAQSPEAATVCAELYQVIGSLAGELGVFEHPDVQRALDNAGAHKLVHRDLLPWPKRPLRSARPLDP